MQKPEQTRRKAKNHSHCFGVINITLLARGYHRAVPWSDWFVEYHFLCLLCVKALTAEKERSESKSLGQPFASGVGLFCEVLPQSCWERYFGLRVIIELDWTLEQHKTFATGCLCRSRFVNVRIDCLFASLRCVLLTRTASITTKKGFSRAVPHRVAAIQAGKGTWWL